MSNIGFLCCKIFLPSKLVYKELKIEIEKELEEENWLTPKDVLDWIKKEFPINSHLSYSQVDTIVQEWRKKNFAAKEAYVTQHSLNKSGLPFLRCQLQ